MTEELKRPSERLLSGYNDNENYKTADKNRRKWIEYSAKLEEQNTFLLDRIDYLENSLKIVNDNLFLETQQSADYHAEIVELKRENQRLGAENLAIKTLLDEAKKTPPQELPVIPQFVADIVECSEAVSEVLDYYFESDFTKEQEDIINKLTVNAGFKLFTGNYIAWLKINGYEVEKFKKGK